MRPYDRPWLLPGARPAGNRVAMETLGVGRSRTGARARQHGHRIRVVFVGPVRASGPQRRADRPLLRAAATWENADGSKLTATQIAVSPAAAGSIPLQLVKANPAMGTGAMTGVTYIQRVSTQGGVAPAMACGASNVGARQVVQYQADYIF